MSRETDKQERGSLQHAAEHERPHRRGSVLIYLVILFAAAFVLLLMSFLMQQRANREAMDNLQQTSDSTVQSLENLLEENQTLKEENTALKAQAEALEEELDEARNGGSLADSLRLQLEALTYLNQVRACYNDGRNTDARDVIARAEDTMAAHGGMEAVLGQVSAALTQEQREDYDPLEAWQSLTGWLS